MMTVGFPKKYKASFLVVLYNKEITASASISSFLQSSLNFKDCSVVVWNNGPKLIKCLDVSALEGKGFDVIVEQTPENESLAKIYNKFLGRSSSCRYVILDDDSHLNDAYFKQVFMVSSNDLGLPLISANGKAHTPWLNSKSLDVAVSFEEKDKVKSVSSGLVLGEGFVEKIVGEYSAVFDDRFYLYGVDSTFFIRANRLKMQKNMKVILGFDHSFSKFNQQSESQELLAFRKKERSCDIALQIKYYKSKPKGFFILFREIFKHLIKKATGKSTKFNMAVFCRVFLSGKHYKDW